MAEGVAVDEELLLETGMEFDEPGETALTEDKTADELGAPQTFADGSEAVQTEDPEAESRRAFNNLYRSLNIAPENAEDDGWRLHALHLFGTHDLSTDDILGYFGAFSPSTIEWIDDASCNVVWTDSEGPARALLELTSEIASAATTDKQKPSVTTADTEQAKLIGESFDTTSAAITLTEGDVQLPASEANDSQRVGSTVPDNGNNVPTFVADSGLQSETVGGGNDDRAVASTQDNQKQQNEEEEEEEDYIIVEEPPMNFLWRRTRRGVPNRSGDRFLLFVRFACDEDRKRRGAHLRSQFYLKYGNPHFDGIRSLVSRSLRRKLTAKQARRAEYDEKRMRADMLRQKSTASCDDAEVFDYEPAVRELNTENAFHDSAKDDLDAVGDDSGAAHVWAAVAEQLGESETAQSRPRDISIQLRTAQGARRWPQANAQAGTSAGATNFDALLNTFRANQIVRKARERQRSSYGAATDTGFAKFDDVEEGELPDEEGDGEQEAPTSARHERGRGEKRMRMHADFETDKVRDSDRQRSVRRSTEFGPDVGRLSVSVSLAGRNRTRAVDLEDSSRRREVEPDTTHRVRVDVVRDARNRLGKRKVSLEDGEYENDDEELDAPRAQKDLRDVLRSRRTASATHRHGGSKKGDY